MNVVDTCRKCRGAGWVVGEKGANPCPVCRPARRKQHLIRVSGIPPRYQEKGFSDFRFHHKQQEKACKRAIDYAEEFTPGTLGLLFIGPCGIGKTHLATSILKELILEKGVTGRFVDETELLRRLMYSYSPDTPETEREVMRPLMDADLVVWDDLGTGRPTEWVRETMRTVINNRYTNQRTCIFTTNLPLKESTPRVSSDLGKTASTHESLVGRIGARLFSRIMEMCEVVKLEGPDARLEGADTVSSGAAPSHDLKVPASLLQCPNCLGRRVTQVDQSKPKRSRSGTFTEISCHCQKCAHAFVARFYKRTAKVEYPEL